MYKAIKDYLAEDWTAFQEQFKSSLVTDVELMCQINDYLSMHNGKQLRPLLCLLSAKVINPDINYNAIRCAASSELLHMATLVHDDVADNSILRRGNPSIMALYSPSAAVLVGDFWLSRAVREVTQYCDKQVLLLFSQCISDLAEGEIFQMSKAVSLDTTMEDYRRIIYCKTASLFRTSILSGAYCAGASDSQIKVLENYAIHLGLSFQMMDDIMDYDTEINSGKPVYQDIAEHKMTLPFIGACAGASAQSISEVKEFLKKGDTDAVVAFVKEYKGVDYSYRILNEEIVAAKESLAGLPLSDARNFLLSVADGMNSRRQ